jgi:diguanylate cyclase (GGDEF)-like protein
MIAQGKAIGVFYLNSDQNKPFNQRITRLAKKVAESLSLSLVNLQLREELRQMSIVDALTGLYNRYYLKESLKREIELAKRKNYPLSIIMIDVDHFKRFNDAYGHDAGDKVLSTLGNYLKSNIRGSDVACRYGGEELTLILPESSHEDSYKRAEALREGIQQLQIECQEQSLDSVTASFGIAVFPTHALTGEGLMQKADEALYTAKRQGRNRVVIYE